MRKIEFITNEDAYYRNTKQKQITTNIVKKKKQIQKEKDINI